MAGHSIRYVAKVLGYSASAIGQELARNSVCIEGKPTYRSNNAQGRSAYRKKRYNVLTYRSNLVVRYVAVKHKEYWTPEQIHGRLMIRISKNLKDMR